MDIYWIWLTGIPGIGCITIRRLLEYFHDPLRIYEAGEDELQESGILTGNQRGHMAAQHSLDKAERILQECRRKDIWLLNIKNPLYPTKASCLLDAPSLLYIRGGLQPIGISAAVVGSRRCTQQEKKLAASIAEKYTTEGYTVISGVAKGIDSYAHTVCLQNGGYTLAFLGNGPDICYKNM